jgi:hypothetical protein
MVSAKAAEAVADHYEIMDLADLNDADWSEIAKLERAYQPADTRCWRKRCKS